MASLTEETEEEEEMIFLNVDLDVFARVQIELSRQLCALVRGLPRVPRRLSDTLALFTGSGSARMTTYTRPAPWRSLP